MPNQIVEHQDPDYTRANEVMNGREKKLFAAAEEYQRTGVLSDAFHVEYTANSLLTLPARWRSTCINDIW